MDESTLLKNLVCEGIAVSKKLEVAVKALEEIRDSDDCVDTYSANCNDKAQSTLDNLNANES